MHTVRRTVVRLVLLAAIALPGFTQNIRSTVMGRVTDGTSASVPGASITITNLDTNQKRSVTTAATGDYVIPQLEPGPYTLVAEREGFRREITKRIVLETGQDFRVDISLKLGTVSETIEVEATAPLLNADNSNIGGVVEQRKIVELPLNGRNYLQLAVLQPNVLPAVQGSANANRGGLNIAGASEVSNLYVKDGIDNNSASDGASHTPILDTVREFKVMTGTYSAEYGRASGAQVMVTTKSGGNDLHGSMWEFHRNSAFDARNFFAPSKPPFRRNQFGAVAGGRLRRDKTFFFLGYEGQLRGQQDSSRATLPNAALRSGDFSGLSGAIRDPRNGNTPFPGNRIPAASLSPQGVGLLSLYPLPNTTGTQNFNVSAATKNEAHQFMTRGDHRFSEKDSAYLVYEWQDSGGLSPLAGVGLPGYGTLGSSGTQHAVANWTHIFSPQLIAEVRAGYSRLKVLNLQEDYNVDVVSKLGILGLTDVGKTPFNNGAPRVSLTGYAGIGGGTSQPQGRGENTYHYVATMTYIRGTHTFKMGGDYFRFLFNSFNTSTGRGSFNFDGRYTGNSVADLLLGFPFQASRALGEPFHNAVLTSSGAYFQDDWKLNARLTLNLGIRYELYPALTERVNKLSSFDPSTNTLIVAGDREAFLSPTGAVLMRARAGIGRQVFDTDYNNFAPRVGLAYRPANAGKTVIRAGAGLFYDIQMVGNGITPLSRSSPFREAQQAGPFSPPFLTNLRDMFNLTTSTPVAPGIQRDIRTAYIGQYSFGVQHELARNLVLDVTYMGSAGRKLPVGLNINQALPGTGTVASRRPYRGWGGITGGYIMAMGNSNFNSMAVRLERRLSEGLSFLTSYAWSKSLDYTPGVATDDAAAPAFAQNARDLRAERGVSTFHTPHRFVMSPVYSLPFGKMVSNRFAKAVISGWQTTGIFTWQAGRPFTITSGRDESNTDGGADRPNAIGDWRVADPTPSRWFNPCTLLANGTRRNCAPGDTPAWQVNAVGTFGNVGRTTMRGAQAVNVDLGIYRRIPITERISAQFRGEVFNVANRATFLLPIGSSSAAAFGQITGAVSSGDFGAQRQFQLALKLVF
jgi:hypothetical protein